MHNVAGKSNDPGVLAFDGLFSQAGEVFFKVINNDHANNMTLSVPVAYFHNPYFFEHERLGTYTSSAKPRKLTAFCIVLAVLRSI